MQHEATITSRSRLRTKTTLPIRPSLRHQMAPPDCKPLSVHRYYIYIYICVRVVVKIVIELKVVSWHKGLLFQVERLAIILKCKWKPSLLHYSLKTAQYSICYTNALASINIILHLHMGDRRYTDVAHWKSTCIHYVVFQRRSIGSYRRPHLFRWNIVQLLSLWKFDGQRWNETLLSKQCSSNRVPVMRLRCSSDSRRNSGQHYRLLRHAACRGNQAAASFEC